LPTGTYDIVLEVTDNAGNREGAVISRTIVVDNNAPITSFNSFVEGTNPQFQYWPGGASSTMFYNPAQAGSFDVVMNATDAGVGVNRVAYPDIDGAVPVKWNPAGGNDAAAPYSFNYTWIAGATSLGSQTTTAFDNAGNSSTASFTVTR